MSVAAHKFGGPPGVGALLLRRDIAACRCLHGGGQERDYVRHTGCRGRGRRWPRRPGWPSTGWRPTAHGSRRCATAHRRRAVARWTTSTSTAPPATRRLPGNTHFTFRGCEGDALLMLLDAKGIECSTGSACTAGVAQPSHVLIAMGADAASARGSLRFSLGHTSTDADVDAALRCCPRPWTGPGRLRWPARDGSRHARPGRDEWRRRLLGRRRAHGRRRPRRRRRAPGAVLGAGHAAHRLARLLLEGGRRRRPARRRHPRIPSTSGISRTDSRRT